MVFTGTYEHSIDAKNRLAIPARIRTQLQRDASDASGTRPVLLYVILGKGNVLCLYTEKEFDRRAEELERSERDPDDILQYEEMRFTLSEPVELDSVGRVRLPEDLLKMAGLGSDVVLLGVKDHMQIRDRQAWFAYRQRILKERPDMLMNPRQAMRKPAGPTTE